MKQPEKQQKWVHSVSLLQFVLSSLQMFLVALCYKFMNSLMMAANFLQQIYSDPSISKTNRSDNNHDGKQELENDNEVVTAKMEHVKEKAETYTTSLTTRSDYPNEDQISDADSSHDMMRRIKRKCEFLKQLEGLDGTSIYNTRIYFSFEQHRRDNFPNLLSPIKSVHDLTRQYDQTKNHIHHPILEESTIAQTKEVYMDYAGGALVSMDQWNDINNEMRLQMLGNPHSTNGGPASSRTCALIQEAKTRIMNHFDCFPDHRYGFTNANSTNISQRQKDEVDQASSIEICGDNSGNSIESDDSQRPHPGYDIIFTSGTTEGLKLVAELFPWSCCSKFVYTHNAHTSVIGMRSYALQKNASFNCIPLEDITSGQLSTEKLHQWSTYQSTLSSSKLSQQEQPSSDMNHHLLAVPLECNFGGDTVKDFCQNVSDVVHKYNSTYNHDQRQQQQQDRWYTLLDMARAASHSCINLKKLNPDFATISFYKMFGYPTGLGALFIKRSHNVQKNLQQQSDSYFGGGSVEFVLSNDNISIPRPFPNNFSYGTCNYRGIIALRHGMKELNKFKSMNHIELHTKILMLELVKRLKALKHTTTSSPTIYDEVAVTKTDQDVIEIYGAWSNVDITKGLLLWSSSEGTNEPSFLHDLPGPTVSFNIKRYDGTYVGYNEVSKLAFLNNPPIQLRTGCMCNPGGCQRALDWTNNELYRNYIELGHKCGDDVDLVFTKSIRTTTSDSDGHNEKHKSPSQPRPTGVIRISLGKDSIWEDIDAFIEFIQRRYVSSKSSNITSNINDHRLTKTKGIDTTSTVDHGDIGNPNNDNLDKLIVKNDETDDNSVNLRIKYLSSQEDTNKQNKIDSSNNHVRDNDEVIRQQALYEYYLKELYIYPIKSCSGMRIHNKNSWKIDVTTTNTSSGCGRLMYDREFALVDMNGNALRLHQYPKMALIQPIIDIQKQIMIIIIKDLSTSTKTDGSSSSFIVSLKREKKDERYCHNDTLRSRNSSSSAKTLKVCGNLCRGVVVGEDDDDKDDNLSASKFFSQFLGIQCWLVRYYYKEYNNVTKDNVDDCYNDDSRPIQEESSVVASQIIRNEKVAFANEAPLLAISEYSVYRLNDILKRQGQPMVSSQQFRPNIVIGCRHSSSLHDIGNTSEMSKNNNSRNNIYYNEQNDNYPHPEDLWYKIKFRNVKRNNVCDDNDTLQITSNNTIDKGPIFQVTGPCARCQMVDINPKTGNKHSKTLSALSEYRRQHTISHRGGNSHGRSRGGQIVFGVFLKLLTTVSQQENTVESSSSSSSINEHFETVRDTPSSSMQLMEGMILDVIFTDNHVDEKMK